MRVLVELFDREPVENVLASCVFKPDIVVFLCDERESTFFKESAIYRLFKRRKLKTLPRFYYFDATDPVGVRRILDAIVRDYPGCVFDFTGGSDLLLLVAGTCFAELQLPGFYIDVENERFINLRGCGHLAEKFCLPQFSAEDLLAMAGATIQGYGHYPAEGLGEAFEEDVLRTFAVVQKNPRAWAGFASWLQAFCAGTTPSTLTVEGPRRLKGGLRANPVLLQHLQDIGLVSGLHLEKNHARFTFKSAQHRKLLLIEGVWLELYCFVVAKRSGHFSDVRTSMIVDWAGVEGNGDGAKNEVDVFLVKDVTPVFISCKMSLPTPLAMSEIRLLSAKFGGKRSRTVVLTAATLGTEHKALKARAEDLQITLLDRTVTENGALAQRLLEIARPRPTRSGMLVNSEMLPLDW